jgi:hypothetical protein
MAVQRLIELCPDEETRSLFLHPTEAGKLEVKPKEKKPSKHTGAHWRKLRKYWITTMSELLEAEKNGDRAAAEFRQQVLNSLARGASIAAMADSMKTRRAMLMEQLIHELRTGDV